MAKRRKADVLIVEGTTDETALALIYHRIVAPSSDLIVDVTRGDIFTKRPRMGMPDAIAAIDDPVERVRKSVLNRIEERGIYRWQDIRRIVQLTDTDGMLVPDSCVVTSSSLQTVYHNDHIETPDVARLIADHKRRDKGYRALVSKRSLRSEGHGVPYYLFFFSRNMEHALHNRKESLSEGEKARLAELFEDRYANDVDGFIALLESDDVRVGESYSESWRLIRTGCRSLERGSNLHLLFRPEFAR